MTKRYKIVGLDCPNCAKSLELHIGKLDSVKSTKINFVKGYIEIEADDQEKAVKDAIDITKQLEPDANIVVENKIQSKRKNGLIIDLCCLIVGIVLTVITCTVQMPNWTYWCVLVASALLLGYKTYIKAIRLLFKGTINENLLVTISVVGAVAVGEHMDGLMVVALYSIGKILESLALNKSKKSIEDLTNIKPEKAFIVENDEIKQVEPKDIEIGDICVVRAGEKVAVDGVVFDGDVSLNTQSLTGESLPVHVTKGDEILSGSIVLDGVVYVKATKPYKQSTVNKILELIENATDKKAKTETVISKMSKWYTLAVIALAVAVWGIVWAVTKNFNTAVYRGLIFLVISCPCAFAISVPLAYFSGIGVASKNGILVKGSNYLDCLAKLDVLAFDKTGTITTGEFEIVDIENYSNYTDEQILFLASLGEQHSNHPLAKAIVKANKLGIKQVQNLKEIAGEGVSFDFENKHYFVGRKNKDISNTAVELIENDVLIAKINMQDTIKATSAQTVADLKQLGIKTAVLSGDNAQVVEKVCAEIGIDEPNAKLLPEDKFAWIENKKQSKLVVGYVGDGINDAPSLTLADVGISMGLNGTPASIEASDIVIANDNPAKIVEGIKISKFTRKIVWENIIVSAVIKILFLTLGAFGVTGMLSAVIADVGVTVLAILNSLRVLKFAKTKQEDKHKHCKTEVED